MYDADEEYGHKTVDVDMRIPRKVNWTCGMNTLPKTNLHENLPWEIRFDALKNEGFNTLEIIQIFQKETDII